MSEPISTKPYFIRALYEWCSDCGYTPYIVVKVRRGVRVPVEFVKNGEIVLNISFVATHQLKMGNQAISFKARFGEVSRDIYIPIDAIAAIFASENHQGMAFEVAAESADDELAVAEPESQKPAVTLAVTNTENVSLTDEPTPPSGKRKKPSFKVIK